MYRVLLDNNCDFGSMWWWAVHELDALSSRPPANAKESAGSALSLTRAGFETSEFFVVTASGDRCMNISNEARIRRQSKHLALSHAVFQEHLPLLHRSSLPKLVAQGSADLPHLVSNGVGSPGNTRDTATQLS